MPSGLFLQDFSLHSGFGCVCLALFVPFKKNDKNIKITGQGLVSMVSMYYFPLSMEIVHFVQKQKCQFQWL